MKTRQDMGELIAGAQEIRNQTGATVLFVHHPVKSGDVEWGSSALFGAMESVMKLEKSRSGLSLVCKKHRDYDCFDNISLALVQRGDSLVVESSSVPSPTEDGQRVRHRRREFDRDFERGPGLEPDGNQLARRCPCFDDFLWTMRLNVWSSTFCHHLRCA